MQQLSITHCILSLASNVNAEQNLALARAMLSQPLNNYTDIKIQAAKYSPIIFSEDKDKINLISIESPLDSIYHNQIAWLSFVAPIAWEQLYAFTKLVERLALRHEFTKPMVSLDMDILAICASKKITLNQSRKHSELLPLLSYPLGYFPKPAQTSPCVWYGITRRFPLAHYDKYGINYLLTHQFVANSMPILPLL